jgi:transcriptional regulator with XRE-family HTH domain
MPVASTLVEVEDARMGKFCEFLREVREEQGLTQEALAAKAGISTSTVYNLERMDDFEKRPYRLKPLLEVLGMSIEDARRRWQDRNVPAEAGAENTSPEDVIRREIEGFSRILDGEALHEVWTLARELCQQKLSKAIPRSPARPRVEHSRPVKPGVPATGERPRQPAGRDDD